MKKVFRWVKITLVCCFVVASVFSVVGFVEHSDFLSSSSLSGLVTGSVLQAHASGQIENATRDLPENSIQESADQTGSTSSAKPGIKPDAAGTDSETNAAAAGNRETVPSGGDFTPDTAAAQPGTSPLEPASEAPRQPSPAPDPAPTPAPAPPPPVAYVWGYARTYHFRTEVIVTNNGPDLSQDVRIHLPMLENNSPYQTTVLQSTNYSVAAASGRVSTFNIGDLQPGESKSVIADYAITVRTVSINSTNTVMDTARQAYNQFAGSGNCYTLASGFVNRCRELGLTARVVNGFTRPQRGDMTAGSLQGCRHSWAEFFVDGLGWVPVDLTFQYFANLPYASHIVETYADQSIRVNFTGGNLSVSWQNSIL